jgi:acyl-CoA synthetase (NDP forming)
MPSTAAARRCLATTAEIVEFTQQQGIALNFFAATGNEAQVAIADVVDYLVDDPATRVFMIFAETIRNTERFSSAAARAFAARKPIVVLKVGSSEIAASVAKAHTGSLVGDDRVFTAACRKLNIIRVTSLEDLVITAGLLAQTGPRRRGAGAGARCAVTRDQSAAGHRLESGSARRPGCPERVSLS